MRRNGLALLLTVLLLAGCCPAEAEERPVITIGVPDHPLVEDWETNRQTIRIEEVTGVDLQFVKLPNDRIERNQKLELMILSGGDDLPDVVISDLGGLSAQQIYGDMGMIVPINEYLDHTPYLDESLAACTTMPMSKEEYVRYITCTDGNVYGFAYAFGSINNSLSMCRLMVYEPWLEALEMQVPETTEAFRDLLRAIQRTDLNGNGKNDEIPLLSCKGNVNNQMLYALMNPFIYTQENYLIQENGQLVFAPVQTGWKDGLAYIKSLMDEGLLSPLSFTQDNAQMTTLMAQEETIAGVIARPSASNLPASDPRREQYVIIGALEGPSGIRQQTQKGTIPSVNYIITKNCEEVEAAVRVGDYLSSIEMNNWSRYGVEGENWAYMDTPGESMYASLGFAGDIQETNQIWGNVQNTHWCQTGPVVGDGSTITYRVVKESKEGNYNHTVPIGTTIKRELDWVNTESQVYGMIFTQEEQEIVNEFRASIEEYVVESFALFVTGERDLDTEWKDYVQSFYNMGLDSYMTALQTCWDRMNVQ